jgi:hypothetical protein
MTRPTRTEPGKAVAFDATFQTLRGILQRHARKLLVVADGPGNYQVASPTLADRTGRPLFVAAVQINKRYVSYHLIPVYTRPELLKTVSPGLRQRMQGKSCFNFTAIDAGQAKELSALTKAGIASLSTLELPWAPVVTAAKRR